MEFLGDFRNSIQIYISLKEKGIVVGQGKVITMEDAQRASLGEIFDRVVVELVGKMEEMKMVSFCSKVLRI